jgi:AcrR family transcriptional regulator
MPKKSDINSNLAVRKKKNRKQILAAAKNLFYEKGFGATPLREIIKESALSTTVFYSLFQSKRDLLVELLLPLGEEINERLNEAFKDSKDDGDTIETAIHIVLKVYARNRKLTKIYVSEAAAQNLHSDGPLRKIMDRLKELVVEHLRIATSKGFFRSVDPVVFAYSVIAMIDMHLYRWAVLGELTTKEMLAGSSALAQVLRSGTTREGAG